MADDDSDDSEMFCEALSGLGKNIQCECTTNGLEAIEKLNNLDELPKLIFLDLNMPVMNGWQCIKFLKAHDRYKNIPIIMISTSSHKKDIKMAFELEATGYLVKPGNFKILTRILSAVTVNIDKDLKSCISILQTQEPANIFAGAPMGE